MWRGKTGPCTCFFCEQGKEHPTGRNGYHNMTGERGHLQVAESLDPSDIVWTRICELCSHEECADSPPSPAL